MLSLFPRDVLYDIWDLIESVSEGFPTYFFRCYTDVSGSNCYTNLSGFNCYTDVCGSNCYTNMIGLNWYTVVLITILM